MAKTDYKKDMNVLVKGVKKLGRKVCDKDTYDQRQKKHLIIQFRYQGRMFHHPFPTSPGSYSSVKNNYADVRKTMQAKHYASGDLQNRVVR